MKLHLIILVLLVCSSFLILKETQTKDELKLVWSDEFDYKGLPDETKWNYDVGRACDLPCGCGWGNNELQTYTQKDLNTAQVSDGILTIAAQAQSDEIINSARLVTRGKASWKYGRIDVRAQVAQGRGLWSAIWMLPLENKYGIWPRSGEIDIMEHVGYSPDTIVGSAHTESYNHGIGTHKNGQVFTPDAVETFHVYSLVWEEDQYQLLKDDEVYFTYKKESEGPEVWPFDQEFYLILNLAFGGNWGGFKGVDADALPSKMLIDYVRVYQ